MPTRKPQEPRKAIPAPQPVAPPETPRVHKKAGKRIVLAVLKLRRHLQHKFKKLVTEGRPTVPAPAPAIPPLPPPEALEDRISHLTLKVEEVTAAARELTAQVLARGENLEVLCEKAEQLLQASQDFGKRCKRLKGMPWWARLATAGAVTVAAVVCAVWGVRRGAPPFGRVSPPGGRVFFTRSRRYDRMHFWPAGRLMEKQ
ncbi:hypothetical protein CHLRE_04g214800v5 [Chlamydomonas reinhardtii]|uniref:Uncharacterized protein n=1 Tax=Chlamydomonas reinhardtii TaxID=3055 RepID=A8J9R8_CHLRE|nr:uncharacterized protein CHLRE_04g214800v5 [Chlamydomonas reinhardtii]PNW83935.1 hypothetical protein CHLRE_04g214800v5 [Chlamydomonas reinhardtii]|eukprot:XP_001698701.1 R-SNARE protein, VAMP-like family [Chlamydomonas reinhardtii]